MTDNNLKTVRNNGTSTVSMAIRMIVNAFRVQQSGNRATVICLEGEAGIGKTAAVYQAANELTGLLFTPEEIKAGRKVHVLNYKLMTREKEDVGGYPRASTTASGMPCFEYSPEKNLAEIEASGDPAIFFCDEWPRADKPTTSAMFAAIEDGLLGSFRIPMNWLIVAACNPAGEYQHNGLDSDPAYRRRMCWVTVEFNQMEFLRFCQTNFHPAVYVYTSTHTSEILDVQARNKGFVYANPAAWEKVSKQVQALEDIDPMFMSDPLQQLAIQLFCQGILGKQVGDTFTTHLRNYMMEMSPQDILLKFNEKRGRIESYLKRGRIDHLSPVAKSVSEFVVDMPWANDKEKMKTAAYNFAEFMGMLPLDTVRTILSFDKLRTLTDEAERTARTKYITRFTQYMRENPKYEETVERLKKIHTPAV